MKFFNLKKIIWLVVLIPSFAMGTKLPINNLITKLTDTKNSTQDLAQAVLDMKKNLGKKTPPPIPKKPTKKPPKPTTKKPKKTTTTRKPTSKKPPVIKKKKKAPPIPTSKKFQKPTTKKPQKTTSIKKKKKVPPPKPTSKKPPKPKKTPPQLPKKKYKKPPPPRPTKTKKLVTSNIKKLQSKINIPLSTPGQQPRVIKKKSNIETTKPVKEKLTLLEKPKIQRGRRRKTKAIKIPLESGDPVKTPK